MDCEPHAERRRPQLSFASQQRSVAAAFVAAPAASILVPWSASCTFRIDAMRIEAVIDEIGVHQLVGGGPV
jgi:hypothetical protein